MRIRDKDAQPCPAHHFAIIGDSNVYAMDLGSGCTNLGVAGNNSKDMAERFTAKDVAALQHDLVIWTTANDIHRGTDYGVRYIRKIALEARAAGMHVVITTPVPIIDQALMPPRGHETRAHVRAAIARLAGEVRELGHSDHFSVADLHAALVMPDGTLNRALYFAQGSPATYEHLNRRGREAAWRTIMPLLSN